MKVFIAILFVFLIACTQGKLYKKKKNIGRSLTPESVALEIEYLGTCSDFETNVIPQLHLSSQASIGCLPFVSASSGETNDLNGDYLCRDFGDRSVIQILEVFTTATESPSSDVTSYIISLIANAPFRVNLIPKRLPTCTRSTSICSVNIIISACQSTPVTIKRGFIVNKDRIFFAAGTATIVDGCLLSAGGCCAYLSESSAVPNFCLNTPSTGLLSFPKKPHHENEHHEHEHEQHHEHEHEHHDDHEESVTIIIEEDKKRSN